MKIVYKIKAWISFIVTIFSLFVSNDIKVTIGFLIYTLLMYAFYIDEYLTEIKDGK
jgi:hypothetical protein